MGMAIELGSSSGSGGEMRKVRQVERYSEQYNSILRELGSKVEEVERRGKEEGAPGSTSA